jgi:phosphate transport system substrate-binding protein
VRSPSRRMTIPIAMLLAVLFVGAGCSKTEETKTGNGNTTGSSAAPGPDSGFDYPKLSGTLKGSGSSFQQAFEEAVIEGLKESADKVTVNYDGSGSSQGKKELADKITDYAGTDSLVKDEEKANFKGGDFLYFPIVAAPITVAYNVKGIDKLQLSPVTIAKIFGGDIKTWDDKAIKDDNPGATLPGTAITIVHRADGSGTTSTFTKYLTGAAGADWKLGAGDSLSTWPADSIAGAKNAGMVSSVKGKDGAIGYIDFSDAKAGGVALAAIKNKSGKFVEPTLKATSAALDKAKAKDDLTLDALNTEGDDVYPITATTYILVYKNQTDAAKGALLKGFLTYVLNEGQGLAESANFARLPDSLQKKATAQLETIKVG